MPLQMSLTLDNGIELPAAYVVICVMVFTYGELPNCVINLDIFTNQAAYNGNKDRIEFRDHVVMGTDLDTYFSRSVLQTSGLDPITQAEQWLTTQGDYLTAVIVS